MRIIAAAHPSELRRSDRRLHDAHHRGGDPHRGDALVHRLRHPAAERRARKADRRRAERGLRPLVARRLPGAHHHAHRARDQLHRRRPSRRARPDAAANPLEPRARADPRDPRPDGRVRHRGRCGQGRHRRQLRPASRRGARHRRRVRIGEERVHALRPRAHSHAARADHIGGGALQGTRPGQDAEEGATRAARRRDGHDLPGSDDLAEPGVHDRRSDLGGAAHAQRRT